MPVKRKQTYQVAASKKRRKQDDRIELGDPGVWEVDRILEEDARRYKIAWASNSVTGETYPPTWEKKSDVNQEAIQEWEDKKQQLQSQSFLSSVQKRHKSRSQRRLSTVRRSETPAVKARSKEGLRVSSPPTPIPHVSRRVIDSPPSIGSQQPIIVREPSNSGVSPHNLSQSTQSSRRTIPETLPALERQSIEITLPHYRQSQQESFFFYDSSSLFSSSQVITGTAPQPEHTSPRAPASQPLLDAASAPNLTQEHSQFVQIDTSASAASTTSTSVAGATSSDIQVPTTQGDSSRPIVDDSQDPVASQSYIPPSTIGTGSKTSNSATALNNVDLAFTDQVENISDWSASSPRDPARGVRPSENRSSVSRGRASTPSSESDGGDVAQAAGPSFDHLVPSVDPRQWGLHLASAALPASHISETVEERLFASQPLSGASQLLGFETLSRSLGTQSFDETDTTRRPIGRQVLSLQKTIPSSIDSANFPPDPSSSLLLEDPVPFLTARSQPLSQVESRLVSQALSLQARPERSGNSTSNVGDRETRLGSPFQHSSASRERSKISDKTEGTRTTTDFQTQVSPIFRTSQRPGIGATDYLGLLERHQRAAKQQQRQQPPTNSTLFELSSSSLPRPPSQWPETLHSAPPRPETPSDLPATPKRIMTSKSPQPAPANPSVRIQDIKEAGGPITPAQRSIGMTTRSSANRAVSPALARGARSPSFVPPAEFVPMPTKEEDSTCERYLTLVPEKPNDARGKKKVLPSGIVDEFASDTQDQPPYVISLDANDIAMEVSGDAPLVNEFAVPLFFLGHQRDNYKQTIVWHRAFFDEYLAQPFPEDSSMHDKARELVTKLHQVTRHPDLLNEESFTQAQTKPNVKAQWDKDISTKFRFLHFLFAALSDQDFHVVIDVEQGRLFDILDVFLTGLNIDHIRARTGDQFSQNKGLRITLLPKHFPAHGMPKADLIIGFEGSVRLIEDERKSLRVANDSSLAPLLYLVIPKTAEHIQRYLQQEPYRSMSATRRLAILVENIGLLRNEAGFRQIHDQDSQNCAASIGKWLLDGHLASEWPIDDLPDIAIKDSTSDSQATTASEASQQVLGFSVSKRALEASTSPQAKRTRTEISNSEVPSTINPASLTLSAMTDSADRHMVVASEYFSEMESLRRSNEAREEALRRKVSSLSERLAEHVTALEDVQYRHEEQRAHLVKTRAERDEAYTAASAARARLAGRDEVINKLKGERDEYKAQLYEAKAALHSHVVPEMADMEKLKSKMEDVEREKGKLESRVDSARREADYVRSLYQDVSSKAAALAAERGEMEEKLGDLEKRATNAAAQARLASRDGANKALRAEIKKLRLEIGDRERVLKGKNEEIAKMKEKERGRMGTRGGSVPRSPGKLSSPMRLELPRNSAMGSRATSPRRASPAAGAVSATGKSKLGR